jgi:hypothetical protein
MPVHDWTIVDDGIFHDFHTAWIGEIRTALNANLLPKGYYALAEQHTGHGIADILALHADPQPLPKPLPPPPMPEGGGLLVAEAPPRVRHRQRVEQASAERRRSLAIRHVSGHRLIALLEIVSPANKDRARQVDDFAYKAVDALTIGVHLLLIDLFPPGPHDPGGMHAAIRQRLEKADAPYDDVPPDEPLTLAAYEAVPPRTEIYIENLKAGRPLPDMPLFLRPDRYINVPLETTYQAAYRGMPSFWREVLEGRPPEL